MAIYANSPPGTGRSVFNMRIIASTEIEHYTNRSTTIIRGVSQPIGNDDAANKKYVDDVIATLEARIAALEAK